MTEKINRIIIEVGGKDYELDGGGGWSPGPNSVGSEEIKDGSVTKTDLDQEVNDGLDELNNISLTDEDIEEIFYGSPQQENP